MFKGAGQESLGLLNLAGGLPQPFAEVSGNQAFYINEPVLDGAAVLFSGLAPGHWLQPAGGGDAVKIADGSQWQVSPDRTRVVSYVKGEAGWFVDLRIGESHQVEAPGIYGSNVWDAWSPDGTQYLVQTKRTDPVPGFYLLDQNARRLSTWQEPGYYSFWGAWAPDSRQIAFLSIPIDTVYPRHPEAWSEPQLAPRIGVLDLASGQARYFSLPGKVLGSSPLLWSPDSTKLATVCGELATREETAAMSAPQLCIADLKTGALTPLTHPDDAPAILESGRLVPDSWAPGSQSLAYAVFPDSSSLPNFRVISATGGKPVPLPGTRVYWVDNERLAVFDGIAGTLALHDRAGNLQREIDRGADIAWVTVSPTGAHLAYTVRNDRHALDPPSAYVVVISPGP